MSARLEGAIDCDVHPSVPGLSALLPYLDDYWRDMIELRGIEGFETRAYPPLVPASAQARLEEAIRSAPPRAWRRLQGAGCSIAWRS